MRFLQGISVLEGVDTMSMGCPGKWMDVTADSSVQIISLDHVTPSDTLQSFGVKGSNRQTSGGTSEVLSYFANQTKGSDIGTDYLKQTYTNQDTVSMPSQYGLSGKVWFSDSCLNYPDIEKDNKKNDFWSTGDLTNKSSAHVPSCGIKPILRKTSKGRQEVRKAVSFKESGTETRYFIKCNIDDITGSENKTHKEYNDFDTRISEVEVKNDLRDDSDTLIQKPIMLSCETKLAKVVVCPTISKSCNKFVQRGSCRERIAAKRKLVHSQKETNGSKANDDTNIENSENDILFPELPCKIPRYSTKKRTDTDIGPLSKFLMDNERMVLTSTPKMSRPSSNIHDDRNLSRLSEEPDKKDKCARFPRHLRLGTSHLRAVQCHRKLFFDEFDKKTKTPDVNSVDQDIKTVRTSLKPVRPRLGINCKTSKLVELDTLDASLVCELKKKISKSNGGTRIKTNGSLKCKSGPNSEMSSPVVKCFKMTARPYAASLNAHTGSARLETYV